ncbi:MAG: beta-ketoacyl-ACP synthase II [Deinococcus sp.]|nr:beta-ketoacyl-ACP synthase II [Deinococcus sp.]
MGEQVVVTGIGVVSPVGIGVETMWQSLLTGRSGIGPVTLVKPELLSRCRVAGEVKDFDPGRYLDRKAARRMDRFTQFAVVAALLAVRDGGLEGQPWADPTRVGVMVGTGIGGMNTLEEQTSVLLKEGPSRVSPFTVPLLMPNAAAGQISILLGIQGPVASMGTACATSVDTLGAALHMLQRGHVDIMLAGGSEAVVTALTMAAFASARALTTRNDDPTHASRPFDKHRDGFVLSEGAAVLVLERLSAARARGARMYAELAGYGQSADASDLVAPHPQGRGALQAMRRALAEAHVLPNEVDYVNAHATSTPVGDLIEAKALLEMFGTPGPAVSSTKSMTGHLLGAAGALEGAITALAIYHDTLPPSTNLDESDPECGPLDYVTTPRTGKPVFVAISNSFGFGGHNGTLVLRKTHT